MLKQLYDATHCNTAFRTIKGANTTSSVSPSARRLKRILIKKGYDCIAYMNKYADPGSIGLIVFDESQLIPVAVNGLPIGNSDMKKADSDESAFLRNIK